MQIKAKAPGRKGSLVKDGVGKLELIADTPEEARKLEILFDEIHKGGGLAFWTPIMWAAQQNRWTKTEDKTMTKIITKIREDFINHVQQ